MWDKEGRGGELLVLPGEPELVAAVPRQGVEVGEEGGFLQVLPQEGVEGGKGGPVPVVDVSCRAHFKTVHCALVVCDICEEGCLPSTSKLSPVDPGSVHYSLVQPITAQ